MLVGAVGIHYPKFQISGTYQSCCEEVLVILDFLGRLGMLGAIDDFRTVVGPERAAIVAEFIGQLLHVAAIRVHGENVQIAIAGGGENDVLAIAGDGRFRVVASSMGQLLQVRAICLGGINLVGIVD